MRTVPASGCSSFKFPYNVTTATTGIVRYDNNDDDPTSEPLDFPIACSDEPYELLKPVLKWTVPETKICKYSLHVW